MKKGMPWMMICMFAALGCNNPPGLDSLELAQRTSSISADLASQVVEAGRFLEELESLVATENGLDILEGMFGDTEGEGAGPIPPTPPPEEEDSGEVAQDVEEFLDEYIFNPEQLESEEPDQATYLLKGQIVCSEDFLAPHAYCVFPDCPMGDTWCEQAQQQAEAECQQEQAREIAECIADIDAIEIRLVVHTEGDGVLIRLLIGPDRDNPLMLSLQPDLAALYLSLNDARGALVHIASVIGEELELPETMEGQVSVKLQKHAERDLTLSAEITEAIDVRMTTPEGGPVAIQVQAGQPIASVRVQGPQEILTATANLGRVLVSLPFEEEFPEGSGEFIVDLAGVNGQLVIDGSDDRIHLTGLGLGEGQSQVLHDSVVLASLDINAAQGRSFDLTLSALDELPLLTFSPGLAVDLYLNLGHLDPFLHPEEEPAPAALRDQTYSLDLDGTGPDPQILPVEDQQGQGAIQVVTGSLGFRSTATDAAVVVDQGNCIAPTQECPDEIESFVLCLEAGACAP